LEGGVPRPRAGEGLYRALEEAERADIVGWRPSVALRESGIVKGEVVATTGGVWGANEQQNPYG